MENKEEVNEALEAVKDAMNLAVEIEELLDGQDLMVILMALTKLSGVMLADAKGMAPFFIDEASSLTWFGNGVSMAYRIHLQLTTPTDGHIH